MGGAAVDFQNAALDGGNITFGAGAITGGAGGIGETLALGLSEYGAKVVIASRNMEALEANSIGI